MPTSVKALPRDKALWLLPSRFSFTMSPDAWACLNIPWKLCKILSTEVFLLKELINPEAAFSPSLIAVCKSAKLEPSNPILLSTLSIVVAKYLLKACPFSFAASVRSNSFLITANCSGVAFFIKAWKDLNSSVLSIPNKFANPFLLSSILSCNSSNWNKSPKDCCNPFCPVGLISSILNAGPPWVPNPVLTRLKVVSKISAALLAASSASCPKFLKSVMVYFYLLLFVILFVVLIYHLFQKQYYL